MKKLLMLVIAVVVVGSLVAAPVMAAGKNGPAGNSNVGHLYLCEKEDFGPGGAWNIVEGGAWGKLTYSLSGPTFDFVFNGHGLQADTDYSLIYYADKPDRYVNWGGDNPGALIASGTTNRGGNIHLAGSPNLDMNLPWPPDANINIANHNYSEAPDFYANATGAKIWLVLSDDYSAPTLNAWNPADYLFETDLITYTDTDIP